MDVEPWNLVVTARQGGQRRLRRALRPLLRLETCDFRNVLVGHVDDVAAFLPAVDELRARRPQLDDWLGKVLPIERTFVVDAEHFHAQLEAETTPLLDRLAGHSFHVRMERRGHKGVINSHASEIALGEYLYAALEARSERPVVSFRDADVVLAIEVIGDRAGIALITRGVRQQYPFVKID